jgi:hypothetical protein
MPAIKRILAATTADALNGLNFKVQPRPFLASLWASGANEGDVVGFSVDANQFLVSGAVNVEAASGVVDTSRDQILFREPCPAGELFLPATMTANVTYLLNIEQL